jgi:hypothetical protein
MNDILSYNHSVLFTEGSSFSERESLLNKEILKLQETLRNRGFYPLGHEILNKNNTKATVSMAYKVK